MNPKSQHKKFLSYGLLFEPHTALLFRSGVRGWGRPGGSGAIFQTENEERPSQLVVHASCDTAYQFQSEQATVHVETTDIRIGVAWDMIFSDTLRGAVIWTHQSGHISDNIPDLELMGPDLGNEVINARIIYDHDERWRIGGGLRPFVLSVPPASFFGAEQFVEWYPSGTSENPHEGKPFIAVGLEEYGLRGVELSAHLQAGYVYGDHIKNPESQSIRFVVGAYAGYDTRLKYFQFKNRRDAFVYSGIFIDL